jgi:hypothetical protein
MATETVGYRTSYEFPLPVKQVRHYIKMARTSGERKVWRDLLNSGAYHKYKGDHKAESKDATAETKK